MSHEFHPQSQIQVRRETESPQFEGKIAYLKEVLNPAYEAVTLYPTYLTAMIAFLDRYGVREADGLRIAHADRFAEQAIKGRPFLQGTLLATSKEFEHLPSIDRYNGEATTRTRSKGGFAAIPLTEDSTSLNRSDFEKHAVLGEKPLYMPFDWVVTNDNLYVVNAEGITMLNLTNGDLRSVRSPLLNRSHTISRLHDNKLGVVSTNTELLLVFDPENMQFDRVISAWRLGLRTAKSGKVYAFSDEEQVIRETQALGKPMQIFDAKNPFPDDFDLANPSVEKGLFTSEQAAHFNSLIAHPDQQEELLLATAFTTHEFDPHTGEEIPQVGTGGRVIAITKDDKRVDVVTGMSNPHNLVYLGQTKEQRYFMVTNTGEGRVNIYQEYVSAPLQWKLYGQIAFDTMPEDAFPKYRKKEWLQTVAPSISQGGEHAYLTAYDSTRRYVSIVDLSTSAYRVMPINDTMILHKTVFIPGQM